MQAQINTFSGRNIFSLLENKRGMAQRVLQSYTSKGSRYKYGKIETNNEGLKVFALSSVIPLEPKMKMSNVDKILRRILKKGLFTSLEIEIEDLEESLEFQLNIHNEEIRLFLEKIIYGEVRLKGKYCSEIFLYADGSCNESSDLVMFDGKNSDKLFILPHSHNGGGCRIGFYGNKNRTFLKQLLCSECHYKVNDVCLKISPQRLIIRPNYVEIIYLSLKELRLKCGIK